MTTVSKCYLLANRINLCGCVALLTTHGKHLVELKRNIQSQFGCNKIELFTISRPSAYGEYEPYHFVDTKEEFVKAIKDLSEEIENEV